MLSSRLRAQSSRVWPNVQLRSEISDSRRFGFVDYCSSCHYSRTRSRALALFIKLSLPVFRKVRLLGEVSKVAEGCSSSAEEAS